MSIKRNAILLFTLAIFSKSLAFVREVLLAYFFGIGVMLDAFNTGIVFSNTLLFLFSGGAFIPILITFALESNKENRKYLNSFFVTIILLALLISVITILLAPYFVFGVSEGIRLDVVNVIRITAFSTLFYAISSILRAILNSYNEYKYSGAQDLVMLSVIVAGIILATNGDSLYILSYSLLLSSISRVLVQIPALMKYRKEVFTGIGWNLSITLSYTGKLLPMIFATLIPQFLIIIGRTLSTNLGEGIVSGLSYADRTSDLIKSIVAYSLGAVLITPMVHALKSNNNLKFLKLLDKALLISFWISIPLFFIFLLWGKELVSILYERGSFTSEAVKVTGLALSYYSIATLFSSPIFILMSAMYTLMDWRAVMRTTITAVFIGISVMLLSYQSIGIIGIVISTGVYSIISFILLYRSIIMRMGSINFSNFKSNLGKIITVNTITFGLGYFLFEAYSLLIVLMPIIYIFLSSIFKEEVFSEVKGIIFSKLGYNR